MLFGPPVAVPVPLLPGEIVPMYWVPSGKRIAALVPTKPPTVLFGPDVTFPVECDGSMTPKFRPTRPPTILCEPVAVTVEVELEFWISAMLIPTKPPIKLSELPVTGPDDVEKDIVPVSTPFPPTSA